MGGLLGPAEGLYHSLGNHLAEHDIATMRVRLPQTERSVALRPRRRRDGREPGRSFRARGFVVIGHSFGGRPVAIQAGAIIGADCRGVVTLSTQSAGCENASELGDTPLLLFHGTNDEILPPETSTVVQMLAGHGEVVLLPGSGHLLTEAATELRERLLEWIPECSAATTS